MIFIKKGRHNLPDFIERREILFSTLPGAYLFLKKQRPQLEENHLKRILGTFFVVELQTTCYQHRRTNRSFNYHD